MHAMLVIFYSKELAKLNNVQTVGNEYGGGVEHHGRSELNTLVGEK